jgi:CHAT domain-containing protein
MKKILYPIIILIVASIASLCYADDSDNHRAEITQLQAQSDSLYAVGVDLYHAGRYSEAIPFFTESDKIDKAILDSTSNRREYSSVWLASCYFKLNDTIAAANINQDYYMVTPVDRRITVRSDSVFSIGEKFADIGDYEGAIKCIVNSDTIDILQLRESYWYANSLNELAFYYGLLGDYKAAVRLGTEALNIQEKVLGKNHSHFLASLSNMAFYYGLLGDYSEAIHLGTENLNIQEKVLGKHSINYVISLFNVVRYNSYIGNYLEAIRLGNEALNLCEEVFGKEHPKYLSILKELAYYNSVLENYSEAIRLRTEALNICELIFGRNSQDYAMTLINLASDNSHLGNLGEAMRFCIEAMNICETIYDNDNPIYIVALNNIIVQKAELGKYDEAIRFGNEILNLCEVTFGKDNVGYVTLLNNLANYNFHLGNVEEAMRLCIEAKDICEDIYDKDNSVYAESLAILAGCNFYQGDIGNAISLQTEALDVIEKANGKNNSEYALALANLAYYYSEFGNNSKAIYIESESLNIRENVLGKDNPDCVFSLENLALYFLLNNEISEGIVKEIEYCNKAKNILCQVFIDMTDNERAIYWDRVKDSFLSTVPHLSYKYENPALISTGYSGLLFGKGLLLNAETELRKTILESGNEEAVHAIDELRINRLMLNKQLEIPISERTLSTDSLNNVITGLEHKLISISKEYGDYTKNLRIDVKDVQAKLTKDNIAVEFASFEVNDTTVYCAYLLKQEYESPKMKVCLKQTDRDITDNAYSNPELSKAIWGTLADELQGVKNIYFAPSGELYNIAIESLPDWEDSTKLVSDRWNFYRLSSTRELALIKDKNQIKKSVVYGGLKFNADTATIVRDSKQYSIPRDFAFNSKSVADSLKLRNGVKDLPGTKLEATAIDKQLKAVKIDDILRTDSLGTEASFKALSGQKKNLLHIATHGFYWTESDVKDVDDLKFLMGNDEKKQAEDKALTRSGLLFAGANNALMGDDLPDNIDDGILTAQEISQLDLRGLDLVVLSACETGLGEITGDGVFGLQRGFKKAGAQSIMMSLWKVDDNATQMLMTQFYANLTSGKSKRQSLLDAQRYIREYEDLSAPDGPKRHPYSDPKYWAAFILLDAID